MINSRFEAYKLKRELKRSGVLYEFKRPARNKFKEQIIDPAQAVSLGSILGLYHESNGIPIVITTSDDAQVRTKRIPMILCLYDDVDELSLQVEDLVWINGRVHRVTGLTDIQQWGIIADISLEVFDDGSDARL